MTASPREVVFELLHGVCARDLAKLPTLYAEKTDVVHPFDPRRAPALRTREELREHFTRGMSARPEVRRAPVDIRVHETTDPEVVVVEFAYDCTIVDSGERFRAPGIFVLRVRDGEIVESRDYFDHLTNARHLGRAAELLA
jgi:ketosteroid isomerase-like protein